MILTKISMAFISIFVAVDAIGARQLYYGRSNYISEGKIMNDVTVFHARSIAEDVVVKTGNDRYTGSLEIEDGKVLASENVIFEGKSLIHSAPLTAKAFTKSWMGGYGRYIVTIGLLLFAFSTAISWSYYGDRAITFLFGSGAVVYYRLVYVVGFFFAAFTDTTIIWTLSGITIAMMTIPNLIGILFTMQLWMSF